MKNNKKYIKKKLKLNINNNIQIYILKVGIQKFMYMIMKQKIINLNYKK